MEILTKPPLINTLFRKKIHNNLKIKFLNMLGDLLSEGYSMKEALEFLAIVLDDERRWINDIAVKVSSGMQLDQVLNEHDFQDWITSQIYFAYQHGHLAQTLISCSDQLESEKQTKKELQSLLTYPIFLIVFIIGMLFAMRFILLPQMEGMVPEEDLLAQLAIGFIKYFPQLLLFIIIFCFLAIVVGKIYFRNRTAIELAVFLSQLPLITSLVKNFFTYRFTLEWGSLLESGLSMKNIVTVMQKEETTPMMREIGKKLENGLIEGYSLAFIMEDLIFLNPELTGIILHGEKVGHLANGLKLFSKQCLQELDEQIKRMFQFLQPVLFLFIALLVIVIYGSMLIPMFSFMETL